MNIHKSRNNRIIVELSAAELLRYGIVPEKMDCESKETKIMLNDILSISQKKLDRDITDYNKMLVDVMVSGEGGCIVILSFKDISGSTNCGVRLTKSGYLCELSSADSIFVLAKGLRSHKKKISENCLYLSDCEKYIVYLKPYAIFSDDVFKILCEFGKVKRATESSYAFLSEHSRLLTEDFISSLTS